MHIEQVHKNEQLNNKTKQLIVLEYMRLYGMLSSYLLLFGIRK